jgi:hypothetical protein
MIVPIFARCSYHATQSIVARGGGTSAYGRPCPLIRISDSLLVISDQLQPAFQRRNAGHTFVVLDSAIAVPNGLGGFQRLHPAPNRTDDPIRDAIAIRARRFSSVFMQGRESSAAARARGTNRYSASARVNGRHLEISSKSPRVVLTRRTASTSFPKTRTAT